MRSPFPVRKPLPSSLLRLWPWETKVLSWSARMLGLVPSPEMMVLRN
jgi:hypothetical protein